MIFKALASLATLALFFSASLASEWKDFEKEFFKDFSSNLIDPTSNSSFLRRDGDLTFINYPDQKNSINDREKRNAVQLPSELWPNGIIPYELQGFSVDEERVIYRAMQHWENNTCVRFRLCSSQDPCCVKLFKGKPGECASYAGRYKFSSFYYQGVSLGETCVIFKTVVHELGHVIGLYHEHNRYDRDEYITVDTSKHSSFASQYVKILLENSNTLNLGYDYASIMHYSTNFGAITSPDGINFGDAEELSPLDIAKVNRLYDCGPCREHSKPGITVPPITHPTNFTCGSIVTANGTGSITFPGHQEHAPNTQCSFVIQVPEGYGIKLQFNRNLRLDTDPLCYSRSISMYFGATVSRSNLYRHGISRISRFCRFGDFRFPFSLPKNIITVSYNTDDVPAVMTSVEYELYDKNECDEGHRCDSCVNTVGSFTCTCKEGYYLSKPARTCFDVNECAFDNGNCAHVCTNTGGAYQCSCMAGYYLQADGKSCDNNPPAQAPPSSLLPGKINSSSCDATLELQTVFITLPEPRGVIVLPVIVPTFNIPIQLITAPPTTKPITAPPATKPTTAPPATKPTTAPPATKPTTAPPTTKPTTPPCQNTISIDNGPWSRIALPYDSERDCNWTISCTESNKVLDLYTRVNDCDDDDQITIVDCSQTHYPCTFSRTKLIPTLCNLATFQFHLKIDAKRPQFKIQPAVRCRNPS